MRDPQHDQDVVALLPARKGHFRLESEHHGSLWLDLELLCFRPAVVQALADRLSTAVAAHAPEIVCGPLVEGAFVALMVAAQLDVPFTYSAPSTPHEAKGLFPVRYVVPRGLRPHLEGRRVAVVNDVINAGSAVRGTIADLLECGASPVAIGTLAVLGASADRLAADAGVALETLVRVPNDIWTPSECPLCANGIPLTDLLA
jgi:orotate phosphoribosyltransferase